jgi:ankyrin repeat protein
VGPAHYAAWHGHVDVLEALLAAGVSPGHKDKVSGGWQHQQP